MIRRRLIAVAALVCGLSALPARAQEAREFSLERLRITPDRTGVIDVEWGETLPHLAWDLALWGTFEDDPLIVRDAEDGTRMGTLVHRRSGGSIVGALGLMGWFQLGVELPLVITQSRASDQPEIAPGALDELGGAGLGDIRLLPKIRIVRGIALVVGLGLPSGRDEYRGGKSIEVAPELALSHRFGGLRVAANLGYRTREDQELLGLSVQDELSARIGLALALGRSAELATSVGGAASAAAPFEHGNETPAEALGQLSIVLADTAVLFAGGGAGLNEGHGSPDWRAFAGLRFGRSRSRTLAAVAPPPLRRPEPEPEPVIELAPPPPDTDKDGLPDPDDKCPNDPEDKDDFEDEDGCPDIDDDKDGITDARDRCPREPGPEVTEGCPDPDRDGDKVVDRIDNCPDEPGLERHQGCKGKQLVSIGQGKLEIVEAVYFKTSKAVIEKRSFKLLDDVARVIDAHPEVGVIRVEGHTDDRGEDAANLDLSRRRAEAVKTYLVGKGVPADRLVAVGFGETQPLKPNTNAKRRAGNRRVVFLIVSSVLKSIEPGAGSDTIDR